ncbi:translation initiation factor IF-5A [Streptomyces sp. NPDC056257]|uniref:translation initiation factor IF-5A n=1 Tax=Streptomyces sp. NPDC056257 TaxID=3345765 RepID=UPI0035DE5440
MTDDEYNHGLPDAPAGKDSFTVKASALKKNGYVILKGFPCKIVDMSNSGDKVNLTGIDVFTGKKYEDKSSSTAEVDVPVVTRTEYRLCDISDGYLSLMVEATGETKEDVPGPEGKLGEDIQSDFDDGKDLYVTVTRAMGKEAAHAYRAAAPR